MTKSKLNSLSFSHKLCFILILINWGHFALGQTDKASDQLYVEKLDNSTGLPSELVLRIFEDLKSNMWFCTNNGLTKYNGRFIKHYKNNPDDSNSLAGNWVESITEDPNGRLWLGTSAGLCYFNPEEEKFIRIHDQPPAKAAVYRKDVTACYYDKLTHSIVYADVYGFRIFNLKTGERKFIDFFKDKQDYHKITSFYRDSKNRLWYNALQYGSGWLDIKTGKHTPLVFKDHLGNDKFIQPIQIQENKNGALWICTWGDGLLKVDSISDKSEIFYTPYTWFKTKQPDYTRNIVNKVAFYTNKNNEEQILLATEDNGLGNLDIKTGNFVFYKSNANSGYSLNHNTVTSLYLGEDILWASTLLGVAKIDFHKQHFHKKILPVDNYSKSTKGNDVVIIKLIKDETKAKTYWGITSIGVMVSYNAVSQDIHYYYPPAHLGKYPFRYTYDLMFCDKQNIVIGYEFGIVFFNTNSKQFDLKKADTKKGWPERANSFTKLNNNEILVISRWQGVYKYNTSQNTISPFLPNVLDNKFVNSCIMLKNGDLMFASSDFGVYWYKTQQKKLLHYNNKEKGKFYFPFNECYKLMEDDYGNVWCTSSFGLAYYDIKTSRFQIFKSKENWIADWTITAVKGYGKKVWVLTTAGIIRIDPVTKFVQFYNQKNGLDNLNLHHLNMADSGHIFAFGQDFLFQINPLEFETIRKLPEIKLYDFFVNGVASPLPSSSLIKLSHKQNSLQLSFFISQYISQYDIDYTLTFKIKGLKANIFKEPLINLSFLEPGEYILQVDAKDKNGTWVCKPVFYTIVILPPWYKTWWFITLLAIGLILISITLYRLRTNELRKKDQLKMEIENNFRQMEIKTLRAQMNPHFIFNSLNSIQRYILSNDSLKASEYLGRFSRMIRLVLENSIEPNTTLEMELELLKNYLELEQLRCNHKFSFSIDCDEQLNIDLKLPSMLAQPYLENAIWHGIGPKDGPGHITVKYTKQPYGLDCIITDNGIGRINSKKLNAEKEHRSRGLNLTEQRLKLLNSNLSETLIINDLMNENGDNCGTLVIIKININEGNAE